MTAAANRDGVVRPAVVTITALAILAVLVDAPALVRVPVVLAFALVAPGLATTRFLPALFGVDRVAVAGAVSLAINVVASLGLVALGRWNGEPVLATMAGVTMLLIFIPVRSPLRERREARDRRRNEHVRQRRRDQNRAYELMASDDPNDRRQGLTALSWLLEDDGRHDEAVRLRRLARRNVPPVLPLVAGASGNPAGAQRETELRLAYQHARSEDPETRRRGLFEVAALIDDAEHHDDAETLRGLALDDITDGTAGAGPSNGRSATRRPR